MVIFCAGLMYFTKKQFFMHIFEAYEKQLAVKPGAQMYASEAFLAAKGFGFFSDKYFLSCVFTIILISRNKSC